MRRRHRQREKFYRIEIRQPAAVTRPTAAYCFAPAGGRAAGLGAGAAAGGLAAGCAAGSGAAALLLPPKITRLGLRSKLLTARLMSPSVRRPSAIKRPVRLS